jgi:hypothetical protein
MKRELELLVQNDVLDEREIDQCLAWAREASFLSPEDE